MSDMLVKLYELPDATAEICRLEAEGVRIKRALALDTRKLLDFVQAHFGAHAPGWVDECRAGLLRQPSDCFFAERGGELLGFACHDVTARGMFGPLGVAPEARGRGVGRVLLLHSLWAMHAAGYAYAVIGWAHSPDYYRAAVGAIEIADSEPGIYRRALGR